MRKATFVLSCVLALAPAAAFAQLDQVSAGSGSGSGSGSGFGQATTTSQSSTTTKQKQDVERTLANKKAAEEGQLNPRFVRTLTNVQIELTLSDQQGTQTPEKKTVSMIVSSGNWGKVRSVGNVRPQNDKPFVVDLNVDARPFVSLEGQIQLELTLEYSPPGGADKDTLKPRPTGMHQSLTVVLQSGKPLIVSQAADPVSDRKVIVEVKATILK